MLGAALEHADTGSSSASIILVGRSAIASITIFIRSMNPASFGIGHPAVAEILFFYEVVTGRLRQKRPSRRCKSVRCGRGWKKQCHGKGDQFDNFHVSPPCICGRLPCSASCLTAVLSPASSKPCSSMRSANRLPSFASWIFLNRDLNKTRLFGRLRYASH